MATVRTPFHNSAKTAGAVFGPWHDWELAMSFGNPAEEYWAAQSKLVVHDSSYLGRIKATGEDVLDLLNRLSTNKLDDLRPGHGAATVFANDKGRIVDLVHVFNVGSYILIFTSPDMEKAVMEWVERYTIMEDCSLEVMTPDTGLLSLIGPRAVEIMEDLTAVKSLSSRSNRVMTTVVDNTEVLAVDINIGDTGTYLLLMAKEDAEIVWAAAVSRGAIPMGFEAKENLRIRASIPLYGREMGDAYNPLEAGLIGAVDFTKGCYIGQEVIARLDTYRKVQKRLVALRFSQPSSAEVGSKLISGDKEVGVVTSMGLMPGDSAMVGLGYVRSAFAAVGSRICVTGDVGTSVEISDVPLLFGHADP